VALSTRPVTLKKIAMFEFLGCDFHNFSFANKMDSVPNGKIISRSCMRPSKFPIWAGPLQNAMHHNNPNRLQLGKQRRITMMGEPVLIMLVEDNADHAELVIRTMEEPPHCQQDRSTLQTGKVPWITCSGAGIRRPEIQPPPAYHPARPAPAPRGWA
jgi:hypothetical protein